MTRELWPEPEERDYDAEGDDLDDREGDYDGFGMHWHERIKQEQGE